MYKDRKLLMILPYIILISFLFGAYTELTRSILEIRNKMTQQMVLTAELKIDHIINHNFSKMIGVVTHISTNNIISFEQLDYYVQTVIHSEENIISNIGIFEDTTAIYLYPFLPNKDMSNINLANIENQKDDALRVKNNLEIVITPPVELIQGGIGIMTRMPIVLPIGSYWGQLGYMMKLDTIVENLYLDTDNYSYKLTQLEESREFSHLIYDSGFKNKFLTDEIIVPIPSGFWSAKIEYKYISHIFSIIFYMMVFSAVFFFMLSKYVINKIKSYNQELYYYSQRDDLTGLKNRRAIMESINSFNSVILLDIDDFKKINDTYGHYVGDEVLKILSKRIEDVTRSDDVIIRWGGEEFVILLKGNNKDEAKCTAERIQDSFIVPFEINDLKLNITVSIGVSCSNSSINSKIDLVIKSADEAMYISKNNGKNQITLK